MAAAGAYIRGLQEAEAKEPRDSEEGASLLLQWLGPKPSTLPALLSMTGWSDVFLQSALTDLVDRGLVQSSGDAYSLTDLGLQAHYIVAA